MIALYSVRKHLLAKTNTHRNQETDFQSKSITQEGSSEQAIVISKTFYINNTLVSEKCVKDGQEYETSRQQYSTYKVTQSSVPFFNILLF